MPSGSGGNCAITLEKKRFEANVSAMAAQLKEYIFLWYPGNERPRKGLKGEKVNEDRPLYMTHY